ncbi:rifin [Plasmodium sp. gorilla clade G1]|nr:rifin [Plasmodium sp. gorilla clade G1]
MNVNYKILLFSLLLNILAYNINKPYITTHTPTTTSRVLNECDLYIPKYDNDEDMKSVKENFDRQTSQRFEEYEKRMIKKRQKCKEECDKDVKKIIEKDKIEQSLAEKVEKGCLKCGCWLGGVAASVGIIGPIAIIELKKAALLAATKAAIADGAAKGAAAGDIVGAAEVIRLIKLTFHIDNLFIGPLDSIINTKTYTDVSGISHLLNIQYQRSLCVFGGAGTNDSFCTAVTQFGNVPGLAPGKSLSAEEYIKIAVKGFVSNGQKAAALKAGDVSVSETYILQEKYMSAVQSRFESYITPMYASIIAILIIVLIMVIIYLILRYRRKKKMTKKLQYTKLLSQ